MWGCLTPAAGAKPGFRSSGCRSPAPSKSSVFRASCSYVARPATSQPVKGFRPCDRLGVSGVRSTSSTSNKHPKPNPFNSKPYKHLWILGFCEGIQDPLISFLHGNLKSHFCFCRFPFRPTPSHIQSLASGFQLEPSRQARFHDSPGCTAPSLCTGPATMTHRSHRIPNPPVTPPNSKSKHSFAKDRRCVTSTDEVEQHRMTRTSL